jgi:hypothetical protein
MLRDSLEERRPHLRPGGSSRSRKFVFVRVHNMRAYGMVDMQLNAFLNSKIHGGQWSALRRGHFNYMASAPVPVK